jgi:hypothetical protein
MSSHREAPAISKDPVADNTDTYAFVSPDAPGTVTIITNYLPLEPPFGGPNFYEFGDDVQYDINVDNDGDGHPNVVYTFAFETQVANPNTFLYNTGPIESINSKNWNRRQFYTVTRSTPQTRGRRWRGCGGEGWHSQVIASGLACPPCNIGPSSTPNYAALASEAIHSIGGGRTVFAGQRLDGFYVDLGAIFDLGDLRPFEKLHIGGMANSVGVNAVNGFGVHSIALRVPMSDLTRSGKTPKDPKSADSVIGVWGSASRQRTLVREDGGNTAEFGDWVQVSRLGNPLVNEVIVPVGKKDLWNSLTPADDSAFLKYVQHPELAGLLPALYPGVFPNLAALTAARADLVAILLTGLPSGVVPGFQNYTGSTYADELRLNMAIPATANNPNPVGLVAGDAAGFPNGRRVFDDVVSIELRAIAGLTYPLVAPSYTPDAAASVITDGLTDADTTYMSSFPYLGTPQSGYQTSPLGLVA